MNCVLEDVSVLSGEQNIVLESREVGRVGGTSQALERDDLTQVGVPWCRQLE